MKRYAAILIVFSVMCLAFCTAGAEEFDAASYSYEELEIIQQKVGERLKEMDRQYAIENADRQIVFQEAEQTIFLRQTLRAEPEILRKTEDAVKETKIKWTSSNPETARVTAKGSVFGTAPGDAVITATAVDNEYVFGSYTVHVVIPVGKITVWGQDNQLWLDRGTEEATLALSCSIEPEDAYYQGVSWSSSDETVATVDENGLVRGLAPGTAVITAWSTEPETPEKPAIRATYEITVRQAATGMELNTAAMAMYTGETALLSASIAPENADDLTVIYQSSNPEIAAVAADGTVTATGVGECEITATAADGSGISAMCHVTVTKRVSGLELSRQEIRIAVGETYEMEVLVTPEDATNQELRWASSNVFVARVADGKIEGISQGDCIITCSTTDGSNLSQQATVIIPTFSVGSTDYTVTEKTGLEIPIHANKEGIQITMAAEGDCFRAERTQRDLIRIIPISAGTGTITLSNPRMEKDDVTLTITVENSAVFNQKSYPPFDYAQMMTAPEAYEGKPVSVGGKVLQISRTEDGQTVLMIGTGGEEYTDEVLLARSGNALIPADTRPGEMLTLYGSFYMETIYSDALAAETQIPALAAEKIEKQAVEGTEQTE